MVNLNSMASETTKVKRLYQIPKQDMKAFSLQYKKSTTKDPAKALKGAKLGLMGMGAMQYQNGTPPKHIGLLKKKK